MEENNFENNAGDAHESILSVEDRIKRLDKNSKIRSKTNFDERIKMGKSTDDIFIPPDEYNELKDDSVSSSRKEQPRDEKGRFTKEEPDNVEFEVRNEEVSEEAKKELEDLNEFFDRNALKHIKTKAKVNGEEIEISADMLLDSYQKNSAADDKLEKASLYEKELNKKLEMLAIKEKELLQLEQRRMQELSDLEESKKAQAKLPVKDAKKELKAAADKLLSGDEDGFADILNQFVAPDVSEIEQRIKREYELKTQKQEQDLLAKVEEAIYRKNWEDERLKFIDRRKDIANDLEKQEYYNFQLNKAVGKLEGKLDSRAFTIAEQEFDKVFGKQKEITSKNEEIEKYLSEKEEALKKAKKLTASSSTSVSNTEKVEKTMTTEEYRRNAALELMKNRKSWREVNKLNKF